MKSEKAAFLSLIPVAICSIGAAAFGNESLAEPGSLFIFYLPMILGALIGATFFLEIIKAKTPIGYACYGLALAIFIGVITARQGQSTFNAVVASIAFLITYSLFILLRSDTFSINK